MIKRITTAVVLLASTLSAQQPMIIAHRGDSFEYPENTMAAFNAAWATKAHAAEGDFRMTADGEIIAMHDESLKRTTGLEKGVRLATMEEIRTLDAGSWKSPRFAGEKVPTLAEVLESIPDGKQFYLEVKGSVPDEMGSVLADRITASGKADRITVISFEQGALIGVRSKLPKQRVMVLHDASKVQDEDRYYPIKPVQAQVAELEGWQGLNVSYRGVTPELVTASKAAKLDIFVWTVDDPEVARQMVEMGVGGITTNKPAMMCETFGIE